MRRSRSVRIVACAQALALFLAAFPVRSAAGGGGRAQQPSSARGTTGGVQALGTLSFSPDGPSLAGPQAVAPSLSLPVLPDAKTLALPARTPGLPLSESRVEPAAPALPLQETSVEDASKSGLRPDRAPLGREEAAGVRPLSLVESAPSERGPRETSPRRGGETVLEPLGKVVRGLPGAPSGETLSTLYDGSSLSGDGEVGPSVSAGSGETSVPASARLHPSREGLGRGALLATLVPGAAAVGTFGYALQTPLGETLRQAASGALGMLTQAGDLIGNGLAFYLAVPQLYQAVKDGEDRTSASRGLLMISANLALGLVNAAVAGKLFWGVQNLFGAGVMLAAMAAGAWLKSRGKGGLATDSPSDPSWGRWKRLTHRLAGDRALHATTLASLAIFAGSVAAFYAAAAVVPTALAALLSTQAIAALSLGIQIVTGAMYLMMFLPDILAVARGTPAKGFTPAFSLSFFLASVALFVWAAGTAVEQPLLSPEWWQFVIYAAQNAVYGVVSFVSYRVSRKS